MESGSEQDAKDALSKLLQMGPVAEYQTRIAHKEKATAEKVQSIKETTDTITSLRSEVASPEVKGSLDADEDIGVDEVNNVIDGAFVIGESNVETLGVGEDDDTGNAVTDGGDDAVESGDISILNSLIGHETRVLPNCEERSYIKKNKMKVAIQRRLWDPGIQDEGVTPVLQEDGRPKRPQREKSKPKSIKSTFQDNTLRAMWF
ncbi:hypothetical protein Tco_0899293 [Tanacetum coccineum]